MNSPLPMDNTTARSLWALGENKSTNLIVLWPKPVPPTVGEIIQPMAKQLGCKLRVVDRREPDGPEMRWLVAAQSENDPRPLFIWVEKMRPMSPENIEFLGAQNCQWVVGLELTLNVDDPLSDFLNLIRLAGRAFPDAPAILDVSKEGWSTRRDLEEELLLEDEIIDESLLWFTHAIGSSPDLGDDDPVWMYTKGLCRCGVPELEILGMPKKKTGPGINLVHTVATYIIEQGLPPPGQPFEIGSGASVTLQPWKKAAAHLSEDFPGSLTQRVDHMQDSQTGIHAAICVATPTGSNGDQWEYPREVLDRVSRGDIALYRSRRLTMRQAQHAQRTWDELAQSFIRFNTSPAVDDTVRFLAQVRLDPPAFGAPSSKADAAHDREHVWTLLVSSDSGRVEGELLNQPATTDAFSAGDRIWIDRTMVSDWRVVTPDGDLGPNSAKFLDEIVQQLGVEAHP